MHHAGRYVDVQERVLYNNILGAVELAGENFFYQNPLAGGGGRYPWHGCPCCIGNIPRALLAIKDLTYATSADGNVLFVDHYVAGEGTIPDVAGAPLGVEQRTEYPWKGEVSLVLTPKSPATFTLKLRIPSRAESALYTATPDLKGRFTLKLNGQPQQLQAADGYVSLTRQWKAQDRVDLVLPMDVQRIHADARVAADRGRVALQRGPLVYNIENVDHDRDVRSIVLPPAAALKAVWRGDLLGGVTVIQCDDPKLLAVPNYARLNRGAQNWSQVWIAETPEAAERVGRAMPPADRKDLDKRTVDRIVLGDGDSEKKHGLQGERTGSGVFRGRPWRDAHGGGHFSYDLAVDPKAKNVLLCTYWGSDVGNRRFAILAGPAAAQRPGTQPSAAQKLAVQTLQNNRPSEFFDVQYPIPESLTRGRTTIRVNLQADPGATAGGIFDLRILRPGDAAPSGG